MNFKELIENILTSEKIIETVKEIFLIKREQYNPDYYSISEWEFLDIKKEELQVYQNNIEFLIKDVIQIIILKDLSYNSNYRKDKEIDYYFDLIKGIDKSLIIECINILINKDKIEKCCENTIQLVETEVKRQKLIQKISKMSNEEIEKLWL